MNRLSSPGGEETRRRVPSGIRRERVTGRRPRRGRGLMGRDDAVRDQHRTVPAIELRSDRVRRRLGLGTADQP